MSIFFIVKTRLTTIEWINLTGKIAQSAPERAPTEHSAPAQTHRQATNRKKRRLVPPGSALIFIGN